MIQIGVLDDWQGVARQSADWSALQSRAQVVFFERPFAPDEDLARSLADFDALIIMRERTAFPAVLLNRLPRLRMLALTGIRTFSIDMPTCQARGIVVCNTGSQQSTATTAELTLALLMAAARRIPQADASMRKGNFQSDVPLGGVLEGKTLGIIGLGKIGAKVARYGHALGMRLLAWSQNMTDATASAAGATRVDKETLLRESDAVSLHVVLSDRTRGLIGRTELAQMKPGTLLINTSRGPLIDEAALVEALQAGRLVAAMDVFDQEPLPAHHPYRTLANTVLTPHLGYCTAEIYAQYYRESIENVLAFLDGMPIRVINPEALRQQADGRP